VSSRIHPENIALAIHAAKVLRLELAGVDLISTDISQPYHANGACINEVNYAPVLGRTHAFQRRGVQRYANDLLAPQKSPEIHLYIGSKAQTHWHARYLNQENQNHHIWLASLSKDDPQQHQYPTLTQTSTHNLLACSAADLWNRLVHWPSPVEQVHVLQNQRLEDHTVLGWVTHIHLCESESDEIVAWQNLCHQHYCAPVTLVHPSVIKYSN
jgi:hypothetical protein